MEPIKSETRFFDIKPPEKKELPEIKINPEILIQAKIVVQMVGEDFGMQVKAGRAGQGSFFDPREASITLDPAHFIKENDSRLAKAREEIRGYLEKIPPKERMNEQFKVMPAIYAKHFPEIKKEDLNMDALTFLLGHEGGHRAITRGPNEIGIKKEKIEELYSKIGFAYGENCVEDPADNNWVKDKFPKIGEAIKKNYDEQMREKNMPAGLEHPDMQRAISALGYIPRFAWFGAEVIRYWHMREFSSELNHEIKESLEKVKDFLPEIFKAIPPSKKTEKETIEKARERFVAYYEKIWPELEKLVKQDIDDEKINEMLEKQFEKIGDQLGKDLREELERNKENKEKQKRQKELEDQKKDIEKQSQELGEQIKDLKEKAERALGEEKENLENQIEQKEQEKQEGQQKQESLEQELKALKRGQEEEEEGKMPSSLLENLSEELKKKLKEIFDRLPEDLKKELEEAAKEKLENLEDKLNEEKKGKLNKDNPPSHREIKEERARKENEKKRKTEEEKGRKKQEEAYKKAQEEFERENQEKMSEYEKVYAQAKPIIESLYNKLKKIFEPLEGQWEGGFASGKRIEMKKAMLAEIKPEIEMKMWERRKTPEVLDYRFLFLVDMSSSMGAESGYRKIKETFKGAVVLTEVLNKLGIPAAIYGFQSGFEGGIKKYKDFLEKLNKEKRDELSLILAETGGSTPTAEATAAAWKELKKNLGENNFLVTLTDGQPDSDSKPRSILKKIEKEREIKLVGIGLGPETAFVKNEYPASVYLEEIFSAGEEKLRDKKDFADVISKLLEEMIRNPEKFKFSGRQEMEYLIK